MKKNHGLKIILPRLSHLGKRYARRRKEISPFFGNSPVSARLPLSLSIEKKIRSSCVSGDTRQREKNNEPGVRRLLWMSQEEKGRWNLFTLTP